jgi:hypothetical protein
MLNIRLTETELQTLRTIDTVCMGLGRNVIKFGKN